MLIPFARICVPAGRTAYIDTIALFAAGQRPAAAKRLEHPCREITDQGGAVGLAVQKAALEACGTAHGGRGRARGILTDADLATAHDSPYRNRYFFPINLDDLGIALTLAVNPGERAFSVTEVKTPIIHH